MPVELRKRKAVEPPPARPTKKTSSKVAKVAKVADKVKQAAKGKEEKPAATNGAAKATKAAKPTVGDVITLEGFGGEIETNDGVKTTLKALVDESKGGVVLFTYPKASTPGCKSSTTLPIMPSLPSLRLGASCRFDISHY
jgi:thioredoxin-dependent peroxiredoxin